MAYFVSVAKEFKFRVSGDEYKDGELKTKGTKLAFKQNKPTKVEDPKQVRLCRSYVPKRLTEVPAGYQSDDPKDETVDIPSDLKSDETKKPKGK